jgi:hypothetical protein
MNLFDNKNPGRALADYSAFKLNSGGYSIGLLPDNPDHVSLVSSGGKLGACAAVADS